MFATLHGPLPLDVDPTLPLAVRLRAAVELEIGAGIGLVTDGGLHAADPVADGLAALGLAAGDGAARRAGSPREPRPVDGRHLAAWRATAAAAAEVAASAEVAAADPAPGPHPVAATIVGPYTLARAAAPDGAPPAARVRIAAAIADALADLVATLAAAEPERAIVADAHRRLTAAPAATHRTLSLGAGAERLGPAAIYEAGYASYRFDFIAGPDDWRLAVLAPPDRGLVCGALDPASAGPGDLEVLVWAARYAAASRGRGGDRVGLSTAAGFERLSPSVAALKLRILGEAARLAGAPRDELARLVDPRALDLPPRPRRTSR